MPKIEQNFDENVLNLMITGSESFIFDETNGDYIRMYISNEDSTTVRKTYYSNLSNYTETTSPQKIYYQRIDDTPEGVTAHLSSSFEDSAILFPFSDIIQLPIYRDNNGKIFVKPNDTLEKDIFEDYEQQNYTLTFDFLHNLKDDLPYDDTGSYNYRLYPQQISPSRKEIRLLGRKFERNSAQPQAQNWDFNTDEFKNWIESYNFGLQNLNYVVGFLGNININILNYAFDYNSLDETSLILRLSDPVPSTIVAPSNTPLNLFREIFPTQTEKIFYINEEPVGYNVNELSPDTNVELDAITSEQDLLQSYNDLILSSSLTNTQQNDIIYSIFSSSIDDLNVDYSEFRNHSFFGSAEYKLKNFYKKISDIESYYLEISSSLNGTYGFVTESAVVNRRNDLFEKAQNIIYNFTPYERWMYTNSTSTSSLPTAGESYVGTPPISGSYGFAYNQVSSDAEVLNNFNGLDTVFKISTLGTDVVISGSITTGSVSENITNYWYTGSTKDWQVKNEKIIYNGDHSGDDSKLINFSGSLDTGVDPVSIAGLSTFSPNTTYKLSFKLVDVEQTGSLTFSLGGNPGAPYNTPASHIFNVNSYSLSGSVMEAYLNLPPERFVEAPYNYLVIEAGNVGGSGAGGFSGSIDNVFVHETKDTDGRADIFTDKYRVENSPFYNYNGEFYLSFLAKWPVLPTWENSNISQSYNINNQPHPLPIDSFNSRYVKSDTANNNKFNHYILAASQSYWRYVDNVQTQSNALTQTTATQSYNWEILGQDSITGSYVMSASKAMSNHGYLSAYDNKSFLPMGELFRLYHATSSSTLAPLTESMITDVKLFRKDEIYNGNPEDVLLFSHTYSTSSNIVNNWYEQQLYSASLYDQDNPHYLYNSIPEYFKNQDDDKTLSKFISLVGEHFDSFKVYIDSYLDVINNDYDENRISNNLLQIVGEHFGWEFINASKIKSLLEYYVREGNNFSWNNLTYSIWNNILNNIIYIYKTKGTEASVRALYNCFGIPPEIIKVGQTGYTLKSQTNPTVDFLNETGIRNSTGDVVYEEDKTTLQLLNFSDDNNTFTSPWNTSNTGLSTGVQFVFSSAEGNTTSSLVVSSGSRAGATNPLWKLELVPHNNSSISASVKFSLGSGTGNPSSYSKVLESTAFPIKEGNNSKLWNVLVQRTSVDTTHSQSFEMQIASREDDTMKYYYSGSNTNFSVGSTNYTGSANLQFGKDGFLGSMTEIRTWNNSLTSSVFYQHTFNPESVVGNNLYSFQDLIYRYVFKNITAPNSLSVVKDVGSQTNGNYNTTLGSTFNSPSVRNTRIPIFRFNTRGTSIDNINDHTITIVDNRKFKRNELSPFKRNTDDDIYFNNFGQKIKTNSNIIDISISPSKEVNKLLTNYINDKEIGNLLADKSDSERKTYADLENLRNSILLQYENSGNSIIDINDWIRVNLSKIPEFFWSQLQTILPVGSYLKRGLLLENDILHRNKISFRTQSEVDLAEISKTYLDKIKLDSELNINKNTSLQKVHIDNIELDMESTLKSFDNSSLYSSIEDFIDDESVTSNLINIYEDKIDVNLNINPKKYENHLTNLDITDRLELSPIMIQNNETKININDSYNISSEFVNRLSDKIDLEKELLDFVSEIKNSITDNINLPDDITKIKSEKLNTNLSEIKLEDIPDLISEFKNNNLSKLDLPESIDLKLSKINDNLSKLDLNKDYLKINANNPNILLNNIDLNEKQKISSEKLNLISDNLTLDEISEISSSTLNILQDSLDLHDIQTLNVNVKNLVEDNLILLEDGHELSVSLLDSNLVSIAKDEGFEFVPKLSNILQDENNLDLHDEHNISSTVVTDPYADLSKSDYKILSTIVQSVFVDSISPIHSSVSGLYESTKYANVGIPGTSSFDYTKCKDPSDNTCKIVRKYPSGIYARNLNSGWATGSSGNFRAGEEANSGSFIETTSVTVSIGDTEYIDLVTNATSQRYFTMFDTKRRTYLTNPSTGNITYTNNINTPWFKHRYEPDNPNIYFGGVVFEGNKIGRTSRIHINHHWNNTYTTWGDDENGFAWTDEFGKINYPKNHYKEVGMTDWGDVFGSTTLVENGWCGPTGSKVFDPSGDLSDVDARHPDGNCKSIFVKVIDDGDASRVLRVTTPGTTT